MQKKKKTEVSLSGEHHNNMRVSVSGKIWAYPAHLVSLSGARVSVSGVFDELIRRNLSLSGAELSLSGGWAYPARSDDFACVLSIESMSLSGELKKK